MKKNILIAGVARAGKSTIAQKIASEAEYNHFPVDYIASSFRHNFAECGIHDNVIIDTCSSRKLSRFLSNIIKKMEKTEESFIIDSAHILPKDILPYLDKEKWQIYFMGYPNITPNEKLQQIRRYDGDKCWTKNFNDEKMIELIHGLIRISKEIEEDCKKNKIEFIDTSKNFEKVIVEKINEIKAKIGIYS